MSDGDPIHRLRRRIALARFSDDLRALHDDVLAEPPPAAMAPRMNELGRRLSGEAAAGAAEQGDGAAVSSHSDAEETAVTSREQRIRDRAYRLWIEEGQPNGRADHHWEKAESLEGDDADAPAPGGEPASAVGAAASAVGASRVPPKRTGPKR